MCNCTEGEVVFALHISDMTGVAVLTLCVCLCVCYHSHGRTDRLEYWHASQVQGHLSQVDKSMVKVARRKKLFMAVSRLKDVLI